LNFFGDGQRKPSRLFSAPRCCFIQQSARIHRAKKEVAAQLVRQPPNRFTGHAVVEFQAFV
jgi:hypothetical protein